MGIELSIVMPCLNEEKTVSACVKQAQQFMVDYGVKGEVIVADNGSLDRSTELANEAGARVVEVEIKGYGAAIMGGVMAARGQYVAMGDCDRSYDFTSLGEFINRLRDGCDLVIGNRFEGGIEKGAMPFLHKYIGNPVLSAIGKLFFGSPVNDFHCGLRAFRRDKILSIGLRTTGMEFASEMVVKATLFNLEIAEVPTTLSCDGRDRQPHLRSWRDGWRHLRFLLMFSPRWLFLIPGIVLCIIGLILFGTLINGSQSIFGLTLDVHTLFYSSMMIIIGYEVMMFSATATQYSVKMGLRPSNRFHQLFNKWFSLEWSLLIGLVFILFGVGMGLYSVSIWSDTGFGELKPDQLFRLIIPSGLLIAIGVQTVFFSFFVGLLQLEQKACD